MEMTPGNLGHFSNLGHPGNARLNLPCPAQGVAARALRHSGRAKRKMPECPAETRATLRFESGNARLPYGEYRESARHPLGSAVADLPVGVPEEEARGEQ